MTVFGAVTRKNVRVAAATRVERVFERGIAQVHGDRRVAERASNTRLMLAKRAIAVKTSRLLASRKVSVAGIRTSCGRSRPGGGRSRGVSISVCKSVLPSRVTATRVRSLLRVVSQLLIDVGAASGSVPPPARIRPAPRRAFPSAARRRPLRNVPATRAASRARAPSRVGSSGPAAGPSCTRRPRVVVLALRRRARAERAEVAQPATRSDSHEAREVAWRRCLWPTIGDSV